MWQVVFSTEGAVLIPVEDGIEEDIKTYKSKRHFRQKVYLDFNLSIPVSNGSCIALDFIFNKLSYNKLLYDEEIFPHIIGKKGFEIISRIYD